MTLTQKDLEEIGQIVDEKIKHLPTKDEFFGEMDKVMGELKAIREEQTAISGQLPDHEDRIASLEKIHPHGAHPAV